MAEVRAVRLPWPTLWKVIAAVALVWLWVQLWYLVMIVLVAIIIAVGLAPVVRWLEERRLPRWAASATVTLLVFATILGFLVLTWSSLSDQARDLGTRLNTVEQELTKQLPAPVLELLRRTDAQQSASMLAPYAVQLGRALLGGVTAFVMAFILVLYLLIEGEATYAWVRRFVPAAHRARFDRTTREAREVAFGYVVGNVVTSACAGIYVYIVLTALGVPASLLLALLAFFVDFIPVLGFFLSVLPAIIMAMIVSPAMALAMIPIYLFYDFLENYFIAPRVYGARLEMSNLAVLLAFAVGAQLAGVVGALLALPMAAVFPTIDRLWLRREARDNG